MQKSSFYWNPHSTYTLKLISYSLLLGSFWYDLLVLKCFFGWWCLFTLIVNKAKVPREVLSVSTLVAARMGDFFRYPHKSCILQSTSPEKMET